MHRIRCVPVTLPWKYLLALAVCAGMAAWTAAQEPLGQLIVPLKGTVQLQMSTKKAIANVQDRKDGVVSIAVLKNDPTTILLTGLIPNLTEITLTDVDGKTEVYQIVVQTDIEHLRFVLKRVVPTANVEPIPSGSTIIMTGTVQRAEDVQVVLDTASSVMGPQTRVINGMRVGGVMQVQLEVVVARVARSEARSMGFSFIDTGNKYFLTSILNPGAAAGTVATAVGSGSGTLAGSPNAVFGIINDQHAFLGFLEALRKESLVKVLARPTLVTLSGRPAEFISGGEQAVPDLASASGGAGSGAVAGIRFVPFGTTVRFLPIVMGNGKIYLEVEPAFSFPDPSNLFSAPIPGTDSVVFGRTTQRVQTTVLMEDGQTFAIGGLIFSSVNGSTTKVPVLGDLPFIGTAFSNINYTESEEELLVLVTPRLVDALACNQLPSHVPGQESRSPDDFELFLERILEAPRGPRDVISGHHYVPAFKNSPTCGAYPCGGHDVPNTLHGICDVGNCFNGLCGLTGCANGACPPSSQATPGVAQPTSAPVAPGAAQPTPGVEQPPMTSPLPMPRTGLEEPIPVPGAVPVPPASGNGPPPALLNSPIDGEIR